MKIELQNSIVRLSFLCRITNIKIAWIIPAIAKQNILKTLNKFLKNYFFIQNLFYIKGFSNKIVFKFSKIVELKIVNDLKIG